MKALYFFLILHVTLITVARSQVEPLPDTGKILNKNYYEKLVANPEEVYTASIDSIYVDTLILNDRSTIRFRSKSILIVENAFIGQQCRLTSSGLDGNKPGTSGSDGKDLTCIMIFRKLESFIIETRGRNGKQGGRGMDGGRMGTQGNNGGLGRPGGNGGNGGNLKLAYLCDGFTPSLNSQGPHSIQTLTEGGLAGEGGKGGSPGRPIRPYPAYGQPGQTGENGIPGRNGIFVFDQIH